MPVKLGYSLLNGALPVAWPPRLSCTHLSTLTFMLTKTKKTKKHRVSLLPVTISTPESCHFTLPLFLPPSRLYLPYNNRDTESVE